jgi:hypothetical protein
MLWGQVTPPYVTLRLPFGLRPVRRLASVTLLLPGAKVSRIPVVLPVLFTLTRLPLGTGTLLQLLPGTVPG